MTWPGSFEIVAVLPDNAHIAVARQFALNLLLPREIGNGLDTAFARRFDPAMMLLGFLEGFRLVPIRSSSVVSDTRFAPAGGRWGVLVARDLGRRGLGFHVARIIARSQHE